jgi:hypothetical protein
MKDINNLIIKRFCENIINIYYYNPTDIKEIQIKFKKYIPIKEQFKIFEYYINKYNHNINTNISKMYFINV